MNTEKVFTYLQTFDLNGQEDHVENTLKEHATSYWMQGYLSCTKNRKKRNSIEEKRVVSDTNQLLDYINDLIKLK